MEDPTTPPTMQDPTTPTMEDPTTTKGAIGSMKRKRDDCDSDSDDRATKKRAVGGPPEQDDADPATTATAAAAAESGSSNSAPAEDENETQQSGKRKLDACDDDDDDVSGAASKKFKRNPDYEYSGSEDGDDGSDGNSSDHEESDDNADQQESEEADDFQPIHPRDLNDPSGRGIGDGKTMRCPACEEKYERHRYHRTSGPQPECETVPPAFDDPCKEKCFMERIYDRAYKYEEDRQHRAESKVYQVDLTDHVLVVGDKVLSLDAPFERILPELSAEVKRSRFGDGTEYRLDETVRDAWEIKDFKTTVTAAIQGLFPKSTVKAYKLNLYYSPTGHFEVHQDTHRSGLVKTVVLFLNSTFTGGALRFPVINYQYEPSFGKHNTISFSPYLPHAVDRVREGVRATITFNVFNYTSGTAMPLPNIIRPLDDPFDGGDWLENLRRVYGPLKNVACSESSIFAVPLARALGKAFSVYCTFPSVCEGTGYSSIETGMGCYLKFDGNNTLSNPIATVNYVVGGSIDRDSVVVGYTRRCGWRGNSPNEERVDYHFVKGLLFNCDQSDACELDQELDQVLIIEDDN